MKITNKKINNINNLAFNYPLEKIADINKILFVDIETTGLFVKSSTIYLIGCAFFENGNWNIRQWFSDTIDESNKILSDFLNFSANYSTLITFNGNRFDFPFIDAKCKEFELDNPLTSQESIDLYKEISGYRNLLCLENCKQKTIEKFLGINREDKYSGQELIEIYAEYQQRPSTESFEKLILHNADDINGMFNIMPILFYPDLFEQIKNAPLIQIKNDNDLQEMPNELPVKAVKVAANYYDDINRIQKEELFMKILLPFSLPVDFKLQSDGVFFETDNGYANIRIPIYDEEMKYFYTNYKDYYYLPDEDQAIHKSVAKFVDRSHRVQASARNCYTRKPAQYLPEWDLAFIPFFKRSYDEHSLFFELTDSLKKSRNGMSLYALHILRHLFFDKI